MRTTLVIPKELLDEAREILGFKSKTDTIIVSLQELIRRKKIEGLKQLAGKLKLNINVSRSRRRKK